MSATIAYHGPERRRANRAGSVAIIHSACGMVVFAVLASVSIALSRGDAPTAAVWLPNAIAVAALLRLRIQGEPLFYAGLFIGNVLANSAAGDALATGALLALANIIEIAVAATLVRSWCGPRPDLSDTASLSRFMVVVGLVAPLASTVIASLAIAQTRTTDLAGMLEWFLTDALCLLIIAPIAIELHDAWHARRWPDWPAIRDGLILMVIGVCVTLMVFGQTRYPLLFLIPPIVVANAFRLGSLGAAIALTKVAVIAIVFTQAGHGPINLLPYPHQVQMLVLKAFLASAVVVGLPVAAVLSTRLRLTREIAKNRRQLALLADNITDAVLRYDLDGVCTYASPSVQRVLGTEPAAFVGMRSTDWMHLESRELITAATERLVGGASDSERLTFRRFRDDDDGNPVYIEADCAIARDAATKRRDGIIVSARDVTARVLLERQLKRAMRHAEHAARAKAQFLANMSHEIRTPMNGVLGFADLLQRMDLGPVAARYAGTIARSGRSMMALLNDILDVSKIESGQMAITSEAVDIVELLDECVELYRVNAERKNLRLRVQLAFDVPRYTMSDPLRLRQILLNLIGNAVKFTETGTIEIRALREGNRLAITVEDSGIGIDPERLENIFEPFVQQNAATNRQYGGTGLGLSISRQLAELLGGSLSVDSIAGVGSRFTLRIDPIEADVAMPAVAATSPAMHSIPGSARILLAEDHDVNRMLMTAMLEQLGQHVAIAHDGAQAIEMVIEAAGAGHGYDLVLMDIQMPGCDGYAATRAIRSAGIDRTILPIIALTANAFPEDVAAALEVGMQGHVAKPVVFDNLAEMLARWLPVRIVEDSVDPKVPSIRPDANAQLADRWQRRRSEALDAVRDAVAGRTFDGGEVESLIRTVHKLAGSAGMFGEDELGSRAAALERALRSGVDAEVRRRLAEELLELA